jgi:single-strand DNA-binding protein
MNKILISGFLGKDPELKKVSDKFTVCSFSIPYSEKYKDEKITHWFNCKAINQTAEFVSKYFHKGDGIEIEGKLLTHSWTNKEGEKRIDTFIQVENVSFPPNRKEAKPEPKIENGKINVEENPISEDLDLPF